jgi:hypothetical protein
MAHHHAVVAADHAAEIGQLGSLRIDSGDIFEAVGQPERACAKLGLELRRHPGERGGIGPADRVGDADRAAERAVAGEHRDVEVDAGAIDCGDPAAQIEILADPRPVAVLAEDDRGDAHREEALVRILERVAMAVRVDEAGREDAALARHDPAGRSAARRGAA